MARDIILGSTKTSWSRGPEPGASPSSLTALAAAAGIFVLPRLLRGAEVSAYRARYRSDFGGRRLRRTMEVPAITNRELVYGPEET